MLFLARIKPSMYLYDPHVEHDEAYDIENMWYVVLWFEVTVLLE